MFKKLDPGPTIFGNPDLNLDPTSVKTPDPELTKPPGSAFVAPERYCLWLTGYPVQHTEYKEDGGRGVGGGRRGGGGGTGSLTSLTS